MIVHRPGENGEEKKKKKNEQCRFLFWHCLDDGISSWRHFRLTVFPAGRQQWQRNRNNSILKQMKWRASCKQCLTVIVWHGPIFCLQIHARYILSSKHRRNLAVTGGVAASILAAPIVAGLAVGEWSLLLLLFTFIWRSSPFYSRLTVLLSHVILKEWLSFFSSMFLNIHKVQFGCYHSHQGSGGLLPWLHW